MSVSPLPVLLATSEFSSWISSIQDLLPHLFQGALVTVKITLAGIVVAAVAAFTAGLAKAVNHSFLGAVSGIYIEVFRGTSALIQLFWCYFGLPLVGVDLNAMTVAILVLGLNIGAYGAEVVRGAVGAVPRGQHEASIALNLSAFQKMRYVILPQALVAMLPPFGNLMIELLKSTALVSLITISDLTFEAQKLRFESLQTAKIFSLVLLIYFGLSQLLMLGTRKLEKTLAIGRK